MSYVSYTQTSGAGDHYLLWDHVRETVLNQPIVREAVNKEAKLSDEQEIQKRLREDRINREVERRRKLMNDVLKNYYVEGDVFSFTKKSKLDGKELTYLALLMGGYWWITGSTTKQLLEELLLWVFDNPDHTPVIKYVGNTRQ